MSADGRDAPVSEIENLTLEDEGGPSQVSNKESLPSKVIQDKETEEQSTDYGKKESKSVAGACKCKSQCARKQTKSKNGKVTGCPCRANDLLCGMNCSCCTNRSRDSNRVDVCREGDGSNAQKSSEVASSVEEMLEALDSETLLEVAKICFMSRVQSQLADLIATANNLGE